MGPLQKIITKVVTCECILFVYNSLLDILKHNKDTGQKGNCPQNTGNCIRVCCEAEWSTVIESCSHQQLSLVVANAETVLCY